MKKQHRSHRSGDYIAQPNPRVSIIAFVHAGLRGTSPASNLSYHSGHRFRTEKRPLMPIMAISRATGKTILCHCCILKGWYRSSSVHKAGAPVSVALCWYSLGIQISEVVLKRASRSDIIQRMRGDRTAVDEISAAERAHKPRRSRARFSAV